MSLTFHVCDTLTGRIVTRLTPTTWSLTDPLRGVGTGELLLAKPTPKRREVLYDAIRPRRRWIAARDEATGVWVWGGYIPRRPTLNDDGTIAVRLEDWRGWFFRTPLRPTGTLTGDYVVRARDQITVARELLLRALDDTYRDSPLGVPPIKVDSPAVAGVTRDLTLRRLDRPIGEALDSLVNIERGIDWWTYVTPSLTDPNVMEIHATAAYPERTFREAGPIRLEWRENKGGNVAEKPSWPEPGEEFTRVWATGDAPPPAQVHAFDDSLDEGEVLWETSIGPLDGVKRSRDAYDRAYAERARFAQYANAAEFVQTAARLPFGDVAPGDRARVVYDDGWEPLIDVPAARIVERVMSGGADQPTLQRLVVDLSDTLPSTGENPGVPGEEEVV